MPTARLRRRPEPPDQIRSCSSSPTATSTSRTRLAEALAEHQVTAIVCADGAEALLAAGAEHPDAVLATATLPTVGGAALTRALSARTSIPVVVGIGDADGAAAAEALAAGADRLRRPPVPAARAAADPAGDPAGRAGRAAAAAGGAAGSASTPSSLEVSLHGRLVRMPMRELRLLQLLMAHADRVVTREQIRDAVWGGAPGSNTITVHVQRLRQRLGDDQVDPRADPDRTGGRLPPRATAPPSRAALLRSAS